MPTWLIILITVIILCVIFDYKLTIDFSNIERLDNSLNGNKRKLTNFVSNPDEKNKIIELLCYVPNNTTKYLLTKLNKSELGSLSCNLCGTNEFVPILIDSKLFIDEQCENNTYTSCINNDLILDCQNDVDNYCNRTPIVKLNSNSYTHNRKFLKKNCEFILSSIKNKEGYYIIANDNTKLQLNINKYLCFNTDKNTIYNFEPITTSNKLEFKIYTTIKINGVETKVYLGICSGLHNCITTSNLIYGEQILDTYKVTSENYNNQFKFLCYYKSNSHPNILHFTPIYIMKS